MVIAATIDKALAEGRLGTVALVWAEDPTADDLADAIADVITDVGLVQAGCSDVGIGFYEYWGATGIDSQLGVELSEGYAVVCIPGVPADLPLPGVRTVAHGGGCDGEHSGRCRESCRPWDIELHWTPSGRSAVPSRPPSAVPAADRQRIGSIYLRFATYAKRRLPATPKPDRPQRSTAWTLCS